MLLAGKSGDRPLRAASLFWRSKVLVWGLQGNEALRAAQESQKLFGALKDPRGEAHSLVLCADLQYNLGNQKEAKSLATSALSVAGDMPECAEPARAAQEILSRMQAASFAPVDDGYDLPMEVAAAPAS